jgi:hypothetical protein
MSVNSNSLPRAISTGIVVVVLIALLLIGSSTTNRIDADRQQKLVDAVTAQTEAVNAQTKALLAFLELFESRLRAKDIATEGGGVE